MVNVYNPLVVEAALIYENNSDATTAHNVFHFSTGDTPALADLEDLAGILKTWIDVEWKPIASIVWKSVGVRMRQLKEIAPRTYDETWSHTGAILGAAPPNNVTYCISLRTGFGGRSYRGRVYHVGVAEADISDNYMDVTVRESIREAYEALINSAATGGWQWGVYSKFENKAARATGLFTPYTSVITVDNVLDSMRTRLPGR